MCAKARRHWTAEQEAAEVTLTVQAAIEGLPMGLFCETRLAHDHGSQFLSRELHLSVQGVGLTDIKMQVARPEHDGGLDRLHRGHCEEGG